MAFTGVTKATTANSHAGLQQAVLRLQQEVTSGQSYKQFTIVIYESRVVIWAIF